MKETIKIDIPKGYKFAEIDDNYQQVVFEKIGCHYPKTYLECCSVLEIKCPYFNVAENGIRASTYKNKLFGALKQLLICRDAFWKIAGNPYDNENEDKTYCIYYNRPCDKIELQDGYFDANAILDFPTKECRDAFYENFKDLIENCKELL